MLSKANFMKHLAPGNIHGTNLHSIDQCAREAKQEIRDGTFNPEDWERRHRLAEQIEKRKRLGGSTIVPGDGVESY